MRYHNLIVASFTVVLAFACNSSSGVDGGSFETDVDGLDEGGDPVTDPSAPAPLQVKGEIAEDTDEFVQINSSAPITGSNLTQVSLPLTVDYFAAENGQVVKKQFAVTQITAASFDFGIPTNSYAVGSVGVLKALMPPLTTPPPSPFVFESESTQAAAVFEQLMGSENAADLLANPDALPFTTLAQTGALLTKNNLSLDSPAGQALAGKVIEKIVANSRDPAKVAAQKQAQDEALASLGESDKIGADTLNALIAKEKAVLAENNAAAPSALDEAIAEVQEDATLAEELSAVIDAYETAVAEQETIVAQIESSTGTTGGATTGDDDGETTDGGSTDGGSSDGSSTGGSSDPDPVPSVAPAGLAFTDADVSAGELEGDVTLSKAGNEGNVTAYRLYWGSNATTKIGGTPLIAEFTADGGDHTHSFAANSAIPAGATHFLAFAVNAVGEADTGVSLAITDLDITYPTLRYYVHQITTSQVDLQWDDPYSTETGWEIERSDDHGASFAPLASLAANAVSYSDTTVAASNSYHYRIRATGGIDIDANWQIAVAVTPFTVSGSTTSFDVPAGAGNLFAKLWGAGGGGGAFSNALGGAGGAIEARISVTPGETLSMRVGEAGTYQQTTTVFGGGAATPSSSSQAGGGGGGTFLEAGATALIVAGGGGGAARQVAGGAGGGTTGERGAQQLSSGSNFAYGGYGGDQAAGGAAGTSNRAGADGCNGSPGALGVGGAACAYGTAISGGGGGGGYYGGGGGATTEEDYEAYSGGGGGSSYVDGGRQIAVTHFAGAGQVAGNGNDDAYANFGTGGGLTSNGQPGYAVLGFDLPLEPSAAVAAGSRVPLGVSVTWTDNATNEVAYIVERSNDGSTGWAEVALLAANTTTWFDSSLSEGDRRWYRIFAVARNGRSDSARTGSALVPTATQNYTMRAEDEHIVIPTGVTSIDVKMWAAGGGATALGDGGGAGAVIGTLTVAPGDVLLLRVGQGGNTQDPDGAFGGGGGVLSNSTQGASGGGGSYIFDLDGMVDLVIAGGGGGAANARNGGAGGGANGAAGGTQNSSGSNNASGGIGGSQVAGGTGGVSNRAGADGCNGFDGAQYQGGAACAYGTGESGGGGGGGYFGGGGGATTEEDYEAHSGGGGGSGFTHPTAFSGTMEGGTADAPGHSADGDRAGAGNGATSTGAGSDGLIIIDFGV